MPFTHRTACAVDHLRLILTRIRFRAYDFGQVAKTNLVRENRKMLSAKPRKSKNPFSAKSGAEMVLMPFVCLLE